MTTAMKAFAYATFPLSMFGPAGSVVQIVMYVLVVAAFV